MGKKELAAWEAALMAKKKSIPPTKPFSRHKYQRRVRWDAIEIPRRVAEARARYPIRHLGDLLLILGIPWSTAHDWAVGTEARSVPAWNQKDKPGKRYHRPARAARKEWLAACKGIPIPKNHEIGFLRYITAPVLDRYRKRFAQLATMADHATAHQQAADEVIGAAYADGIKRRSARRKAKFGHDPIKAALDSMTASHGAPKRTVVDAITKRADVDWTEVRLQHPKGRPTDAKGKFIRGLTERPAGSRKAKRAMARLTAMRKLADAAKRLTDEAMVTVLGVVSAYKGVAAATSRRPSNPTFSE